MRIAIPVRGAVSDAAFMLLLVGGVWAITCEPASAINKFFVPPAGARGDYNGNGIVDPPDYDVWRANFGAQSNLAADGSDNDIVDAADYVVWRRNLGMSSSPTGNWEDPANWRPEGGLPGQFDGAIIHANRTANLSTDVGFISEMRIGDTFNPPGGTLNINPGGKVTTLGAVLMGASNPGQFKKGELNLNGGTLVSFGTFFIAFEPDGTETVNVRPGSLLDVNQNLFGRFGTAIVNQAGGVVDVQNNVIWGEGGDDDGLGEKYMTRSEYNLTAGELKVGQTLAIGGAIGTPRPDSNGRVNVSGGTVTAGDLVFDTFPGEEAILSIAGSGIVRIDQANYSLADADADIAGGFIIGNMLNVSTVNLSGINYTQISSSAMGAMAATTVPEPGTWVALLWGVGFAMLKRRPKRLAAA